MMSIFIPSLPRPLQAVSTLSDDEGVPKAVSPKRRPGHRSARKRRLCPIQKSEEPMVLRRMIQSKCGCSGDCFAPFRSHPGFDSWYKLRKMLHAMTKLDKDEYAGAPRSSSQFSRFLSGLFFLFFRVHASKVFKLLQRQDGTCRGIRSIKFCDQMLCNKAFMRLVSVGKGRFHTINQAARRGEEWCPYDNRFVEKGPRVPNETRMAVHQFLSELYHEAAEYIPDGLNSNKRPRQGKRKIDGKDIDRTLIKHLPHGTINDYYLQCCSQNPRLKIGKKLFSNVT